MTSDPFKYFRVEARELVDELGRGILALEKDRAPELTRSLLRLAHTLKGAARVVKHRSIAQHAHDIEEVLAPLRNPDLAISRTLIDDALKLVDAISAEVVGMDISVKPLPEAVPSAAMPAVHGFIEESLRTVRVGVEEMDGLLDGISEMSIRLGAVRRTTDLLEQIEQLGRLTVASLASPHSKDAEKARNQVASQRARSLADDIQGLLADLKRRLTDSLDQAERELVDVHERAERLRFSPAEVLVASLERTVRDGAGALGKEAIFEAKGGDQRIDALVLGGVQGALVQLVRNAVAHGIESSADRRAAGKSPVGRILVEIIRRGDRVTFACRDDGRGIDLEAVKLAAQRKGLSALDAQNLDMDAVLDLLLEGGLTTSRAITQISGRGIGLDVVRDAATRLGGSIKVHTERGIGTTFELTVPVTLSALDALLVEAGGITTAIPLDAVRKTLWLGPNDIVMNSNGGSIVHDGLVVPFVSLGQSLRVTSHRARRTGGSAAVVIDGGSALAAVGVDRLLGATNIVARPLPAIAAVDPIFAAVSLDAQGIPRPVLDPNAFVRSALEVAGAAAPSDDKAVLPLLVIDDSLTTRMLEQSILESAGYEVDLATSAEEALEKAVERRYALFLVDVEMPGMDGFEFVEKTRADPVLRAVPAILVSSRNAPEDLRRGTAVGASAYIVKSEFDQNRLLETIRRLVAF